MLLSPKDIKSFDSLYMYLCYLKYLKQCFLISQVTEACANFTTQFSDRTRPHFLCGCDWTKLLYQTWRPMYTSLYDLYTCLLADPPTFNYVTSSFYYVGSYCADIWRVKTQIIIYLPVKWIPAVSEVRAYEIWMQY